MYYMPLVDDRLATLRAAVENVLLVETIQTHQGGTVTFTGRLRSDAQAAYAALQRAFRQVGYTPMLRRRGGVDEVVAVEGVIPTSSTGWVVNLLLFLATVASVIVVGLQLYSLPGAVVFAVGLLTMLSVHEFGHYLVARIHGMAVTLPYYIPLPIPPLGTLGAFIRLKSPVQDRRALFDMAVAGPIAGFMVALPVFVLGLILPYEWIATLQMRRPALLLPLTDSFLTNILTDVLNPSVGIYDLFRNPLTAVGWFGMLVTALNLLPAGQLDGGHIAYAALGSWARPLAMFMLVALLAAGWFFWAGWYMWAAMLLFTGVNHPAPLNDITQLNWWRKLLAFGCLLLFLGIVSLRPFAL